MRRDPIRVETILFLWAVTSLPVTLSAATERVALPDGDVDLLEREDGSPFLVLRRELRNPGSVDREVRSIEFARAVPLAGAAKDYRTLGVDGLRGAEAEASSHLFLAVARPDASDGIIAGWITQERGSGSVHSRASEGGVTITGRLEFGRLRIKPGESVITDAFVLASFADARHGLETYADAIAKANRIVLPKIPSGYCTWYSSPHGGASDEKALSELAAFCRRELTKYGFDTILVDDQWQGPAVAKGGIMGTGPTGNFTRHDPRGPYPSGMKANADALAECGIRAGLWFTPFSWDPRDPLFAEHADWFVKKTDGSFYEVLWAGWCLDMTHPEARAFLGDAVRRITREWGYSYLKPDAMWCGLAARCTYPGTAYVDDGFGDAVFHDPYRTGIEAYREGIRTMREAAGPGTYIAACNVAQNFRSMGGAMGLVDAMRIGPDTGADWGAIQPNFHLGTRLYFLHGRVWHNDPDCLMVRAPLTLTQARSFASWIALTGSLNLVSEWLPGLPADRLECIKRSVPNSGLAARPLDLFENMPARVWHLSDGKRHVVGLFNWSAAEPVSVRVALDRLGLATRGVDFIGLDYWSGSLVPVRDGVVAADLPPSGCGIIALAPVLDRPQLLGSSRHITQRFIDVGEDAWKDSDLSGNCRVVGGDPTELRIATASTRGAWKALAAEVSAADREAGATVTLKEEPGLVRVTLAVPRNREVAWSVRFEAPDAAADAAAAAWKLGTPIVSYWAGPGYPGGSALDDVAARQLVQGGWNLAWCRGEELDVVQRHGLRGLITHPLLTPETLDDANQRAALDAFIEGVRKHPALYAYHLTDEPSAGRFPALGRLVAHLRARDPAHLAYINLFPTYASNEQLGTKGDTVEAYTEHLKQYVEVVRPDLLSYDHYQFTNAGDNAQYFLNLSLIRERSLAAGLPFLNIVQASCWVPGSAASPQAPRVPDGEEMRYLVYTTLAYGAQGISYYVYCYPAHEGGIARADGTPTPLYRALESLNREFTAIAGELQPLRSLGVFHAGMLPPGAIPLPETSAFGFDPPVPRVDYPSGVRVQGLLLGCFGVPGKADGAGTHVLVVNLDYRAERVVGLKGRAPLEVFDATSGRWSPVGGPLVELRLLGGGGKLVRVRP